MFDFAFLGALFTTPFAYEQGRSAAERRAAMDRKRLEWAHSRGCSCTSVREMEAWYGPYCPVHRPWPQ